MFYLIGLGLSDERDITVKGLEAIQRCDLVYLESYTSLLGMVDWQSTEDTFKDQSHDDSDGDVVDMIDRNVEAKGYMQRENQLLENSPSFISALNKLETLFGKKVLLADRIMVESIANDEDDQKSLYLSQAKAKNIALLVVGDPLSATTHADILLKCKQSGIPIEVIHNTSILTAIGVTGLFLYHFGPTISIPFFTPTWRPDSFYDKLAQYKKLGFHTLCLLDIKVKEPTEEEMARGRKIPKFWMPPRFMTIKVAIQQLLEIEAQKQQEVATLNTLGIGCARLGCKDAVIVAGSLGKLVQCDFGPPLHSLVIPAENNLNHVEQQMLLQYSIQDALYQ